MMNILRIGKSLNKSLHQLKHEGHIESDSLENIRKKKPVRTKKYSKDNMKTHFMQKAANQCIRY